MLSPPPHLHMHTYKRKHTCQESLCMKTLIALHVLHIAAHARVTAVILGPLFMVNFKLMTCRSCPLDSGQTLQQQ